MLRADSSQDRMIGHAREDLPQAIFLHAKPESLLQHLRGLLEHDHLHAVTRAVDVGGWAAGRERGLAHEEEIEGGQISPGLDELGGNLQPAQQRGGFAFGIEQGGLHTELRDGGRRQDLNGKTVLLGFAVAEANSGGEFVASRRQRRR
ncbi:MAG: hypothetical protein HZA90_02325 [Verrucomicrobia bacterium]|nr:hypothetical protein [Verrucomicrobiota bacterium]